MIDAVDFSVAMAGKYIPHHPQYPESNIMDGPSQLSASATALLNGSPTVLDNAYNTSGPQTWPVTVGSMPYCFEEQMSFPSSPAPAPPQMSPIHLQPGCQECELQFGEGQVLGAEVVISAPQRQGSDGSSNDLVSMSQNLAVVQSNDIPPPNPTQAPRLRSVNSKKRRASSKYGSPDACEGALSDTSLKPRPAHNKAERNYRRRLNSSFEKLLDVMNIVAPEDVASPHDADSARELSKGDVLRLARHRLVALETENRRLREELKYARSRPQRAFSWSGVTPTA